MAPTISVVIPTHNRSSALALTLSHLAKQEFHGEWEVIVCNNLCTDETDAVVARQSFPVPLRLVHENEMSGPAAARNRGAAAARGDFLLFMDNDILVEPDFIQRHLEALREHEGCWILGQIVNLPEQEQTPFGRFRRSLFPRDEPDTPPRNAIGLTGQNFSLPRIDFELLEGFDVRYRIASVEDLDLALRAWEAGIRIVYVPSLIGVHNDWAGFTIRDYCQRQRTYSRCEPLFLERWGEKHPRPQLVRSNLPPAWGRDPVALIAWKLWKQLLVGRVAQEALFGFCALMERLWPWPPLLWRAYRMLLAAAIQQGIREGLSTTRI